MLALGAALSLTLVSGTTAAGTVAARSVTPGRWVREVCSSVMDWIETTGEIDYEAGAIADELATGRRKPEAGRRALLEAYNRSLRLSDELVREVKDVGLPSIAGGARVARDLYATLGDLRDVYVDALTATMRLRAGAGDIGDEAIEVDDEVLDGFHVIGDPVEALRTVKTLAALLESEADCQAIENQYAYAPLDLLVGECFERSVTVVPCGDPHVGEVFFVEDYPGDPAAPFPGDDAFQSYLEEHCLSGFESYLGTSYEDSSFDFSWFQPTSSTWDDGDRQMICYVVGVDDPLLPGSARSSVA
jgi:hypothetical protein